MNGIATLIEGRNSKTVENRIDKRFESLEKQGRKAFIPFTVIGYPTREASIETIRALIEGGADALELGMAFSDPMADGPVIESAAQEAIRNGITTNGAFEIVSTIRAEYREIPITLMTYFNLVLSRGVKEFCRDARLAGVDGITVVDLPSEEYAELHREALMNGLASVMLISPLSDEARINSIAEFACGYLYLVSRAGITGMQERYDQDLRRIIKLVRTVSHLPLCIGFGVSNLEHASRMIDLGADGVIVGSKIVALQSGLDYDGGISSETFAPVKQYVAEMTAGLRSRYQGA